MRRFANCEIKWVTPDRPLAMKSGLTAYRESKGKSDLFSVFVQYTSRPSTGPWSAVLWAMFAEMDVRIPDRGELLLLTSGSVLVAEVVIQTTEFFNGKLPPSVS